ncbi:MAG TPA: ABC transporter ATP-binding protein [Vitreimonas sp.]|nr:ABC transporter ATP-binding protein [Vitreimonas sp.]
MAAVAPVARPDPAAAAEAPLLEVRSVTRRFGNLVAVNDVSFGVREGEIFGIAGPNGAGKSVLFSTIAGFYRPTSGTITFGGRNIVGMAPNDVCRIGLTRTFQTPTLFHSLSVADNVRVGALFGRSRSDDHVDRVLDFLELGPVASSRATNLDLFTSKKVVLGAALATSPRLLLLDEPMAGFSHVEVDRYRDLVNRIRAEWAVTIVVIEHLLDVLIGLSDRMLVLHYGSVLYEGDPAEVKNHPEVVSVYLGGGLDDDDES